eukprot:1150478-Pelagomonas_calceolata.AAC.11
MSNKALKRVQGDQRALKGHFCYMLYSLYPALHMYLVGCGATYLVKQVQPCVSFTYCRIQCVLVDMQALAAACLQVRFLHNPHQPHGYVGAALGSSIIHFTRDETTGKWVHRCPA